MYHVLLYYQFSHIEDPDQFVESQRHVIGALGLMGRVYAASEGINGELSGTSGNIELYKQYLHSMRGFEATEFKQEECPTIPFVKLIVKTRPEIVSLRSPEHINLTEEKGKHLSPSQWRSKLESTDIYTLLDVRNNYESCVGHFEGAICPDVKNFYDFPDWLTHAGLNKDIPVLMYCTGGIRCEKFSVYLEKKGFKDVYQLHGGIINYAQKEGGDHFKGRCFVFDDRLSVPIEKDQKEPLTKCAITGSPCDAYLNCANPDCNKLFICSPEGARTMQGCCSLECSASKRKKPFDGENIYEPTRKWYHYFDEKIEV